MTAGWLPALRALALEAGAAIMKIHPTDFRVTLKSDASPVTAADLAAEAVILPGLRALAPGIPIVSEENPGAVPDADGRFWLVDPLDGTREFIRRNGEFTVNIALIDNRRPLLGVVFAPALGRLYSGAPGDGAWRGDGRGGVRPIRARVLPRGGATVVRSRSHADPGESALLPRGVTIRETRPVGSALKLCLIAEGGADLYPRAGPTMEWDIAAGHAVLSAAGGCLTRPDGAAFGYAKPGFANPPFIARGRAGQGGDRA